MKKLWMILISLVFGLALLTVKGQQASAEELVLPKNATRIEDCAFKGCNNFTGTLALPDGLTYIGESAFRDCGGFTGTLVLPESLVSIGAHAFDGCTGLSGTIVLPKSVTSVGEGAFDNTGMTVFTWEEYKGFWRYEIVDGGVRVYYYNGDSIYRNGEFLHITDSVVIPDEFEGLPVTVIGESLFVDKSGNDYTGTVVIPDSVKRIEHHAFWGCGQLDGALTLPAQLEYIGEFAFNECGFTGNLVLPDGLTRVEQCAFAECPGLVGEVAIPESIVFWGQDIFRSTGLKAIWTHCAFEYIIENGEVTISRYSGVSHDLTIPDTIDGYPVTQIGWGGNYIWGTDALDPDSSLSITGTLTLPTTLKRIEDSAFSFGRNHICCSFVFPEGLEYIGECAFSECGGVIGELNLPGSLLYIGEWAFRDCGFTGDIVIPEKIEVIEKETFAYSNFNGRVYLPESLKKIDRKAFFRTNINGEIDLPENLYTIGPWAFGWTYISGQVSLPQNLGVLGDHAFDSTMVSGEITIPDSLVYEGKDVFSNRSGETVTLIRSKDPVFALYIDTTTDVWGRPCCGVLGCNGLDCDGLTLPAEYNGELVVIVDEYAFMNCTSITGTLTIPEGYTLLENGAFYGCTGLTGTPVLPESLEYIFLDVFAGCSGLEGTLVLPDHTVVEGNPFRGTHLTVIQNGEVIYSNP